MRRRQKVIASVLACSGVLAVGLAGACLERTAAELQQRMVGRSVQELQSCLGEPSDFRKAGSREVWFYVIGIAGLRVTEQTQRSTERLSDADAQLPPGTCVLAFELEDGRIRRFRSTGRSPSGVDASAECTLLVRRCF